VNLTPSTHEPGARMAREMAEQPQVLANLVDKFEDLSGVVRDTVGRDLRGVAFLARGSSDHAALLGRYATELYSGLPCCLVAPSLLTGFGRRPTGFEGWLLVALSQSGHTPEIVHVARQFAEVGASVVAITNEPDSELAAVSELTIQLAAGTETAIPATKTVTAQMLAALAVASGVGTGLSYAEVAGIPEAAARLLAETASIERISASLASYDRLAVVGRSWCYPAALETSLKLQETSGMMAHGFSTADFRHGPIAVCGRRTPALLLAGSGPTDDDTRALEHELRSQHTPVEVMGTERYAGSRWARLGNAGECLLATIRGQQVAHSLALLRGNDPDQPSRLNKVTLTH
jgi:glucosamine--fructose-6-phosphate aminotransferase (isomerizing)